MPTFVAVKIHYDHRPSLAPHLKYSTLPSVDEYSEYLSLYEDKGVGGNGFHECLNFAIRESEPVRFYLPPTCLPAADRMDEEFVVFSFTYKSDRDLPAHVVGVHAGAKILSNDEDGIPRGDGNVLEGIGRLIYHAEAPADLVTLLSPPLKYESSGGIYTPAYQTWGFGSRYIEQMHAGRIVSASLELAEAAVRTANVSERAVLERQIEVLRRIDDRYSLGGRRGKVTKSAGFPVSTESLPDKEIGYLGEKLIYEREVAYVKALGKSASEVEWISQSVPTSPFDIKTIRPSGKGMREHFIEVKSSRADDTNVYISSGQIGFFEANDGQATFALVRFSSSGDPSIRDLTFAELTSEFQLVPIKFRLASRTPG